MLNHKTVYTVWHYSIQNKATLFLTCGASALGILYSSMFLVYFYWQVLVSYGDLLICFNYNYCLNNPE